MIINKLIILFKCLCKSKFSDIINILIMKLVSLFNKSSLTLLTSLFFTGFAVAGDIREIEIGGISIGNSLLELFTKKEIQEMSYALIIQI